ncbi:MAG: long-chain fatty acid--CoA ligase [Candidatus Eremiobacteraeota bacterium]|nr:long-chain fatty acid--CoA ligase [Candidatus Eremiobacteraeota bacterium]
MSQGRVREDALIALAQAWARNEPVVADDKWFDSEALALFAEQIATNAPYARFAATHGYDAARLPLSWRDIPAAPSSAFKNAVLATFDPVATELEFHTSGTTHEHAGRHFVQRATLYDASLLASFDRFMLADRPKLRFLNLVPNPRFKKHSSLGYMMGHVSVLRGDGKTEYFLDDDRVDAEGFARALQAACDEAQPVLIAGTAFAFVALLEALGARRFAAPSGSRMMETGGFKGRVKAVERGELYARLSAAFGIAPASIVAEYGMTELLSQFYDSPESRSTELRVKVGPPWLRTLVVAAGGREVARGETGYLRHVDLANRSSALAIDTEDRGFALDDGFVLIGRDADAPPRGCSLDAEDLAALSVAN